MDRIKVVVRFRADEPLKEEDAGVFRLSETMVQHLPKNRDYKFDAVVLPDQS